MRRRDFIKVMTVSVGTWPLVVRAQKRSKPTIGFLHSASPEPWAIMLNEFRRGLGDSGFNEGDTVEIIYRWAEDRFDRLPTFANDLVQQGVSLIAVGGGDIAALAAKSATTTIPIVFAIGADPVQQGIVASLNHPGGNITGTTFSAVEIRPKLVELLRELIPQAKKIVVLGNPNRPGFERLLNDVVTPAEAAGLDVRVLRAGNEREIDNAFSTLNHNVDGILVLSDPVYANRRDQLSSLLMQHKIPSIFSARENVGAGGLISYGASMEDAYRQAGIYAGRILKG
jgi:putative ABC transport system substrate-binding protein